MSEFSANKFICHLWRVTRKQRSAIISASAGSTPTFRPEFPPDYPKDAKFYLFGTASSALQGGNRFFNNQPCGSTIYWRSQVPVTTKEILLSTSGGKAVSTNTIFYYYLGEERTRLIAIPQSDYNAQITTPLLDTSLELSKRHSVSCSVSFSPNDFFVNTPLVDNPVVVQAKLADPAQQAIVDTVNNAYSQLNVSYFTFGQGAVNYGIKLKWKQSLGNSRYQLNQIYESDLIGSIAGKITAIRVYIVNSRYALSVSYGTNSIIEPLYVTVGGGNPLYANNYPAGDNHAIAQFGIQDVTCIRLDGQSDTFGNSPNVTASITLTDTITPLGFTDHDKPIFYDGLTYVPYYGGSASDYAYGSSGQASNGEIEFAIAFSGIREIDLTSGLYQDAEIITHYYDWGASQLIYTDPSSYFGKIILNDDPNGAYKFRVETKTSLGLMTQKEVVNICSFCTKKFGSPSCGVNLVGQGLVDTVVIASIPNSKTLVLTSSSRPDNYYGEIEFSKNGVIYSVGVAAYKASNRTLTLWNSINASGLATGNVLYAIARCDKTSSNCKKYQGHLLNFGGFENIPKESSLTHFRNKD